MMPLAIAAPAALRVAVRVSAVTTGAISGIATGGVLVGMLGGLATVVMLFLGIAGTNRRNKRDAAADERQRQLDLKAAEDRGWDRAVQIMQAQGSIPPSRPRRRPDHE